LVFLHIQEPKKYFKTEKKTLVNNFQIKFELKSLTYHRKSLKIPELQGACINTVVNGVEAGNQQINEKNICHLQFEI
jgi:hypothetical protein